MWLPHQNALVITTCLERWFPFSFTLASHLCTNDAFGFAFAFPFYKDLSPSSSSFSLHHPPHILSLSFVISFPPFHPTHTENDFHVYMSAQCYRIWMAQAPKSKLFSMLLSSPKLNVYFMWNRIRIQLCGKVQFAAFQYIYMYTYNINDIHSCSALLYYKLCSSLVDNRMAFEKVRRRRRRK